MRTQKEKEKETHKEKEKEKDNEKEKEEGFTCVPVMDSFIKVLCFPHGSLELDPDAANTSPPLRTNP